MTENNYAVDIDTFRKTLLDACDNDESKTIIQSVEITALPIEDNMDANTATISLKMLGNDFRFNDDNFPIGMLLDRIIALGKKNKDKGKVYYLKENYYTGHYEAYSDFEKTIIN